MTLFLALASSSAPWIVLAAVFAMILGLAAIVSAGRCSRCNGKLYSVHGPHDNGFYMVDRCSRCGHTRRVYF